MKTEIMLEFQSAAAALERWRSAARPATGLALDAAAALERAAAGLREAEGSRGPTSDFAAAMRRVEAECYDGL